MRDSIPGQIWRTVVIQWELGHVEVKQMSSNALNDGWKKDLSPTILETTSNLSCHGSMLGENSHGMALQLGVVACQGSIEVGGWRHNKPNSDSFRFLSRNFKWRENENLKEWGFFLSWVWLLGFHLAEKWRLNTLFKGTNHSPWKGGMELVKNVLLSNFQAS